MFKAFLGLIRGGFEALVGTECCADFEVASEQAGTSLPSSFSESVGKVVASRS